LPNLPNCKNNEHQFTGAMNNPFPKRQSTFCLVISKMNTS
jgi:hypothetical protein